MLLNPCHINQALVVRKADSPIHRINYLQRIAWFVLLTLIHGIAIYAVDSIIQPLNNRGQYSKRWDQYNYQLQHNKFMNLPL